MSTDFQRALNFVLTHETEYAKNHYGDFAFTVAEHDPNDSGGTTKFGIDQASHPEVDIENLTLSEATDIYRRCYWEKSGANQLPWPLSFVLFDSAINLGISQAVKLLQRDMDVVDDGIIGQITLLAAQAACHEESGLAIANHLIDDRRRFYNALCTQKPQKMRYLKGWLNRLSDLEKEINQPQ